jgi:arabinogalactan oligomer/maltooligosaccharide transport system substrate-binding protein
MGSYWDPMKAFGDGVYHGEITMDNLQEQLDALADSVTATLK